MTVDYHIRQLFKSAILGHGRTGVGFAFLDILSVPLANAGSTGIGEYKSTDILKDANLAIPFNGRSDLFGSRSYRELALDLKSVRCRLLRNRSRARHVFIG